MPVKLDVKDRKILYELDVNSRQSNSEIAKKTGLSKQVVGFRIKRLVNENVISSFHTVIDISKLGYTIHKSFVRLQNVDEAKLISFLKGSPDVVWIASCDGRYDLAFGVWARDMEYLDKVLKEFDGKFGECVSDQQIATIIRGEYFIRDYIMRKDPSRLRKSFFGSVPQPAKTDEIDRKILFNLANNSRMSSVDIASSVGLSSDATIDRIKRLEKSGIIRHYNFVPNEAIYPYLHYKILVGMRNISETRERTFIEYCRMNPNIVYIVKSLGPWEFEIDMEVDNAQQFRNIMMDLKTKFKNIIKDYSALHIYQVHKYNFCPCMNPT